MIGQNMPGGAFTVPATSLSLKLDGLRCDVGKLAFLPPPYGSRRITDDSGSVAEPDSLK